ncbi:hypothetical protein EJB05_01173, partial [Eragrostis curvula]
MSSSHPQPPIPRDLDLQPGLDMQATIWRKLKLSVNHSEGNDLNQFFLLASFGRSKFRLSEENVGFALQSCLGGNARDFKVKQIGDRVFQFVVSSKAVGFHIYNLKFYHCELFKVFFNLWSDRGPRLESEVQRWEHEQESEWIPVINKKKQRRIEKMSFADAVKRPRMNPLTGANKVPIRLKEQVPVSKVFQRIKSALPKPQVKSVFDRIQFPKASVFDRIQFLDQEPAKNKEPEIQLGGNNGEAIQNLNGAGPSNLAGLDRSKQQQKAHITQQPKPLFCTRCLRDNHMRPNCRSRIKCFSCDRWGHIASHCRQARSYVMMTNQSPPKANYGQPTSDTTSGAQTNEERPQLRVDGNRVNATHGSSTSGVCLDLELALRNPEKPQTESIAQSSAATSANAQQQLKTSSEAMAYNHIDPGPFMPRGFQRTVVPNRQPMVRVVGPRPPPHNEDMAIVAIDPMPLHAAQFANIREVLGEFFHDVVRVRVVDIQPCPFAQAYVRFDRFSDRDRLIGLSPIPFGNVDVYLPAHDQGPNHRRVQFNHVCWLLLIGFPLDYWSRQHIETAIASFGRLQAWEEDRAHLSRVLIKARVIDLPSVPKWIVISQGDDFRGDTSTVQCEIIHRIDPDNEPLDEDPAPLVQDDVDHLEYDFFGFGQMEPGFVFGMPVPEQDNADDGLDLNDLVLGLNPQHGAAPAAQHGPMHIDLNDPVQEGHMDVDNQIEAEQEQIILEPDVPEQLQEPGLQMSLELSFGSSDDSVQQSDSSVNMPVPAMGMVLGLQAQPLVHPHQAEIPDLNEVVNLDLHVHGQNEGPVNDVQLPDLNMIQEANMVQLDNMQVEQEQNYGNPAQIAILPDMNLEAMIGEEAQVNNVMDEVQVDVGNNLQVHHPNQVIINQNIHLGFVQIENESLADPVFEAFTSSQGAKNGLSADSVRIWARHFSPNGSKDPLVDVPNEWAWFFTNILLSPTHYNWATNFLTSKAWECFQNQSLNNGITFCLPKKCPTMESPRCSYIEELEQESDEDSDMVECTPEKNGIPTMGNSVSTSALHRNRKRQRQPAVVETDVRRSDRLKGQNKGYKRSICPHRDCHACSGAPPTLTDSVIRNLGSAFCNMKPEALSAAALQKKKTKKVVIKKTTKKQPAKEEEKKSPNGRKPSKKPGN